MGLKELIFKKREPTKETTRLEMLTSSASGFFSFGDNLYRSDLVQSAIKPYSRHVGKLTVKHFRGDDVNPEPAIRFLLEEPNPMMTMQKMLEKIIWSLKLNGNAFIYLQYDNFGNLTGAYPLQPMSVEALSDSSNSLYFKFYFTNGTSRVMPYTHIIHLRENYNENDLFGDSPAKALLNVMETISITEQGIRQAVKNSAIIKWILKIGNAMRPEDVKKQTKEISDTFLSIDSDVGGVVGIDAKFDLQQVKHENELYIPSEGLQKSFVERIYRFFGINEKIITNTFTEEEFSSWFESEINPIAKELSEEFTRKIFTRRERSFGNKIIFDTANLVFASNKTKLGLVQLLDRGILSINEYRSILNFEPLPEDKFIIRREYGGLNEVVSTSAEGGDEDGIEEQPQTITANEKFDND